LNMDNFQKGVTVKQLLRQEGLWVNEDVVVAVVGVVQAKEPLYPLWKGKRRPDGTRDTPVCAKATVYKIKRIHEAGKLQAVLDVMKTQAVGVGDSVEKRQQKDEPANGVSRGGQQEPATRIQGTASSQVHQARLRSLLRPILRIDLQLCSSAHPATGVDLSPNDELASWRHQNPSAVYTYIQCMLSNKQHHAYGTSLYAVIVFRLKFPSKGGLPAETTVTHSLPILEGGEVNGPLWPTEVGAVPWWDVTVESVWFRDLNGNEYRCAHGALRVYQQVGESPIILYGQVRHQ
jgi:hypothetical protein